MHKIINGTSRYWIFMEIKTYKLIVKGLGIFKV